MCSYFKVCRYTYIAATTHRHTVQFADAAEPVVLLVPASHSIG